jgi:hypothetical protein
VAPKDSSLGFVYVSWQNLQLWVSNFFNGVHVKWMPIRTVRLDNLLPLPRTRKPLVRIIGVDADENVVYLWTKVGVFGLQLDSMQSNKLLDNCGSMHMVYPYKSFFITAGGEVYYLVLILHSSYSMFYVISPYYHKCHLIHGMKRSLSSIRHVVII